MKNKGPLCLFILLCLGFNSILAQTYSHVINQPLDEADLQYMSDQELKILKNEIIAIKGAQSQNGARTEDNVFAQYSSTSTFLSTTDQKNLELVEKIQREEHQSSCTQEEQYKLFLQLAMAKKQMPISLAKNFYGVGLNSKMTKNQRVLRLSDQIMAFWVPQFSDCKDCPYLNHFVTINQKGEVISKLKVEGLLSINKDNVIEITKTDAPNSTTAQPEYYQIMASGELVSK